MAKIWANRLVAGTRWTWDDVPDSRKADVLEELHSRVNNGKDNAITPEQFEEITGEKYAA